MARLLPKVVLTVVHGKNPRKTGFICTDKQNMHWMEGLVRKFSRPGVLVVDEFGRTFVTPKTCLVIL